MELTFKQRLNARKAAEKVLGLKRKKLKADVVPIESHVLPISEMVSNLVAKENLENLLIAYTDKDGVLIVTWSTMKKKDLCYLSRHINIDIDDSMRDD